MMAFQDYLGTIVFTIVLVTVLLLVWSLQPPLSVNIHVSRAEFAMNEHGSAVAYVWTENIEGQKEMFEVYLPVYDDVARMVGRSNVQFDITDNPFHSSRMVLSCKSK
jgi:hypothetical protein